MKIFTFFTLFSVGFCFSQEKYKMVAEIAQNTSLYIQDFSLYSGTNVSIGLQIDPKKSSFSLSGVYQFGGNLSGGRAVGTYRMQYHLLGLKFKYRFLNISKKVSPFLEITALTEVGTNYKDKYISDWEPDFFPFEDKQYYPSMYSRYSSRFYVGTTFVSNILMGCDIFLMKGLHLNISAGYGLRVMRTRYANWTGSPIFPKGEIHKIPVTSKNLNMLDLQLGFSYVFSLRSKK